MKLENVQRHPHERRRQRVHNHNEPRRALLSLITNIANMLSMSVQSKKSNDRRQQIPSIASSPHPPTPTLKPENASYPIRYHKLCPPKRDRQSKYGRRPRSYSYPRRYLYPAYHSGDHHLSPLHFLPYTDTLAHGSRVEQDERGTYMYVCMLEFLT